MKTKSENKRIELPAKWTIRHPYREARRRAAELRAAGQTIQRKRPATAKQVREFYKR
jgi:hypothetical protein